MIEIPTTGFATRGDIEKGFTAVQKRFEELEKRGDGANAAELENLKTQVTEVLEGQKAFVEQYKSKLGSADLYNAASGEFANRVASLSFPFAPDEEIRGVDRAYYNLVAYRADELEFAASVSSDRLPGMMPGIQRHLMNERNWGPFERWQQSLQRCNDELYFLDEILASTNAEYARAPRRERMTKLGSWKRWSKLIEQYRGIGTGSAGAGQEWLPTMFSSQMHDLVQLQTVVWGLFPSVDMPGAIYKSPVLLSDGLAYLIPENAGDGTGTAIDASSPGTTNMTLTAVKLAARMFASSESFEDLIVPILPVLLNQLAKVIARALDDATINGDTASTHMDNPGSNPPSDAPGARDRRKAWDGLRDAVIANSGMPFVDISANQDVSFISMLSPMGVYAVRPNESCWIVSIAGMFKMMQATDGTNRLFTRADIWGTPPTALQTGLVGWFLGRPVLCSEFVPNDTNGTTGIRNSAGGGGTKTQVLCPHLPSFLRGLRRTLTIKRSDERHIELDQSVLVCTWRGDFKPWYNLASNLQKIVSLGRNYN